MEATPLNLVCFSTPLNQENHFGPTYPTNGKPSVSAEEAFPSLKPADHPGE